ncbi:hypothetical protein MMC17_000659 [Xylographa soralifera]|nr:hypothetical protein [Xylographa soralifera]
MIIRSSRLFDTSDKEVPDELAENDDRDDPVSRKQPSIPGVSGARAKTISTPHRREKDSLSSINFVRLIEVFRSRSLSSLITAVTDIANDLLPKGNMPHTAHYISLVSGFIGEARKVRKRRKDKDISLTDQHNILAKHWRRMMGSDATAVVLKEIESSAFSKENAEETRTKYSNAPQEETIGDDDVKVEKMLSRRFSWPDTTLRESYECLAC